MSKIFLFTCESCQAEGSLPVPANVAEMSAGEEVTTNQPCPLCGGVMSAPGGTYKNVDGVMTRVGDYIHKDGPQD